MSRILELLRITPSQESVDYVDNKQQFHLFNLITEQRHPTTWNLSSILHSDLEQGLRMLVAVDADVQKKVEELASNPALLEQAVQAVTDAIRWGKRIYFYGCGATGRLAKQMESSFWRPFWRRLKEDACWVKLRDHLPPDIEERCMGEMTGADRALVSSLEGFEDLQLIGRLQLEDRGVQRGDVLFCVTEGGETSSVIGTMLAAVEQYGQLSEQVTREARSRLYFVYNNPDGVLMPLDRSAAVIKNPAITKVNLATGAQAIAGSTRMQATTIGTFILGVVLEEALARLLGQWLSPPEMCSIGFEEFSTLSRRIASFAAVREGVAAAVSDLAEFTSLEAETYRRRHFSTYFGKEALVTVFIDNTERSPTFRLPPLDRTHDAARRSWVQVWTEAENLNQGWQNFLGRPFRGMDSAFYRNAFETQIDDHYLKAAALNSLNNAGDSERDAYDFSFSQANIERRSPSHGDLGVAVILDDELQELKRPGSGFSRFIHLCHDQGANLVVVTCSASNTPAEITGISAGDLIVDVRIGPQRDPLTVRRQIGLKMLLNVHSTATMALLDRVVGNTMTNVSPSNLKLIGRATFLIQTHVNDALRSSATGPQPLALSFGEANAVLFDAIDYVRSLGTTQAPEVALSIVRILEAVRANRTVTWDEARVVLEERGLAAYLSAEMHQQE